MNSTNKEIDIFELYRRVAGFFKRRWLLILIIAIAGGTIGFAKLKLKGDAYHGNIIVSSEVVSKDALYQKVFPLHRESNEMSSRYFSEYLNADNSVILGMSEFSVDTLTLKNALVISVQHKDSSNLEELVHIFTKFYNSQSDFNEKLSSEMETTEKYLELVENEMADLNKFQEKVLGDAGSNDGILLNISGSAGEIVELYELQLKLEQKLLMKSVVNVSSDGVFKVERKSMLKTVVIWSILFAFLAFIMCLLLELDRESRKRNS